MPVWCIDFKVPFGKIIVTGLSKFCVDVNYFGLKIIWWLTHVSTIQKSVEELSKFALKEDNIPTKLTEV